MEILRENNFVESAKPGFSKYFKESVDVPAEKLGDILEIWNFISFLKKKVGIRDFTIGELYQCLVSFFIIQSSTDSDIKDFLNEIHASLVYFIVNHYIENTNGNSIDCNKKPFAYLLKYKKKKIDLETTLTGFWPEVLNWINELSEYEIDAEEEQIIKNLCNFSTENYGCLEYSERIAILKLLKNIIFIIPDIKGLVEKEINEIPKIHEEINKIKKEFKELDLKIKETLENGTESQSKEKEKKINKLMNDQKKKERDYKDLLIQELQTTFDVKKILKIDKHQTIWNNCLYLQYIDGDMDYWYQIETLENFKNFINSFKTKGDNKLKKSIKEAKEYIEELISLNILFLNKEENVNSNLEIDFKLVQKNIEEYKSPSYKKKCRLSEIVESMITTERIFMDYLQKRNCYWADPRERENILNELSISKDPKRISSILGEFNKKFSYIEYFYYTDSEGQKYDFEPNCQFEAAKQSVRIWQFKTKKIVCNFWGRYLERVKRSWMDVCSNTHYTNGLFLVNHIFTDSLQRYIEWNLSKLQLGGNFELDEEFKEKENDAYNKNMDSIESYSYEKKPKKFNNSEPKINGKKNIQTRGNRINYDQGDIEDFVESDDETNYTKVSSKRSKLCMVCQGTTFVYPCMNCSDYYHLKCINVKQSLKEEFTCPTCLDKLVNMPNTRRKLKKLKYSEMEEF